jgi:hypothetical protein
MNGLCRLSHVKADIAGTAGQTAIDATYLRAIDEVSEEFRTETQGRRFHSWVATRVLAVPYPCEANEFGRQLWLKEDLLSVDSLKVDFDLDNVYELTLTEGSDFDLWNDEQDGQPYFRIDLRYLAPNLVRFPAGPRRVQLTGLWGYSNETEDTGQQVEDAAGIDENDTTITVTSTADIDPGETLVIDDEQHYVSAVPSSTTLTVVRSINGTTAASHPKDTTIYRRRYPRDVEQAVKARVVGRRWDSQSGYAGSEILRGDDTQGSSALRASYAQWRRTISNYRNPAATL